VCRCDGAWWLIDINAPKARFGYLEQDLHTGRFSSGSDRFDLTRWRSDDRVEMYTDASLVGPTHTSASSESATGRRTSVLVGRYARR